MTVDIEVDNSNKSLWTGGTWKLFISRALTAWGDRLWAFGFGLMLIKMHPQNFTVIAAYGLANMLTSIFFGAAIGEWIDNNQRLFAARTFLIIQNTFVALACIVFALQFIYYREIYQYAGIYGENFIIVLLFLLALCANLASSGSKIVVEKDWIVVIAGGDDDKLAKLNSIFRTIDLVCLNLSPALAGVSFDYAGYPITAGIIASWNIVSVVAEFTLLTSIYKDFQDLASKPWEIEAEKKKRKWYSKFTGSYSGWMYYLRHQVRNAGLGLAFLYMTVLGFDNITWAFSLKQCVSETILGFLLGASALVGIAGSLVYPHLKKCLGNVERGGIFGMLCLVSSLSLCVVSVWLPGSPFDPEAKVANQSDVNVTDIFKKCDDDGDEEHIMTSVIVLLAGIISARFGLWISDLSITQIMQENVEESKRGVIGGVQNSFNSFFNMIKFCLVLLMPTENMFGILVVLSFIFICFGAISLTSYAVKEDKLPSPCCKSKYKPTETEDHPVET